jgi:hypothetical protein
MVAMLSVIVVRQTMTASEKADDAEPKQQTIEAHFYTHAAIPGCATTRYNEDIRQVFGLASSGDRITVQFKLPGSNKTSSITGDVKKWSGKELRINDDTNFHVNLLSPDHDKFAYSFETQHGGETIGGCEVKSVELTTSVREYPFGIGDEVFVDWSEGMGPEESVRGVVEGIGTGEDPIVSVTDYDTDEFGDAGKTYDCAPAWVSLPNESDSDETDGDSFGGFEFDHNDRSDESETDDSESDESDESGESEEPELVTDGGSKEDDTIDRADLQAVYSHNDSETLRGHTVYAANRMTDYEMWRDLKLADRLLDAIDPEAPTRKYGIEHICAYGSQQRIGVRMEVGNDPLGNGIITSGFEGFDVEAIKPVGYGDVYVRFQPSERGTEESNESNESDSHELVTDGGREVTDSAEDTESDTGGFVFGNASTGESQSGGDTSGNDAADANDTANENDGSQEVATDALTEIDGVGDVLGGRIAECFEGETGYQTLRNVSHAAASAWGQLAEVNGISDDRARGFFDEMQDAGVLLTPNRPDADACEAVGIDPNIGSSRSLQPHQVRKFSRTFDRTEARDADVHQLSYTNDDNTATLVARGSDRFPNEDDVVDISEFDVTVAPDNVFRADTVSTQWKTKDETREKVLVIEWSHDNPDVDGIDGDGLQRTILSADMANRIEDMTDETIDELTKTQAFRVSNEFRYSDGFGPVCVDLATPSGVLVLAPCIVPGHSTRGFSGPDHRYDIQRIGESDGSDRDSHDDTDRDDHDGHGETSNTESEAETELAADGGTDTDDSAETDAGTDDHDDHSDESDGQDRERPLQRASDAFDDLREGDIIEVPQYKGPLRVSSIARDVGMIGIEFVDDGKRAQGATKHLIRNEHSGDIALVSGRSDKGKVAMITVLERSQDGHESQDDDGESETDDHEDQDGDSHEDDDVDDIERESVLPEADSLETPSGWEAEDDERVATATCDDWHTGSRKTVLFVQHPKTEKWHVREQKTPVKCEVGTFADRSDAVRAFEQVVWNLNEQSDVLGTISGTSPGEAREQARERLDRLCDERDAILNGSGGRLPDADDRDDDQDDDQNDTGAFVFDHSDESESDESESDKGDENESDSDETDEGSGDDEESVADQFDRLTEGMRVSVNLYETDLVVSEEAEVGGRRCVYFEFANGRSGTTKFMQKYDGGHIRMKTGLSNDKGEVTEITVRPEGYDGEDNSEDDDADEQERMTVTDDWEGVFISTSWGYDSTTVNAAQIIDVSDSGKTVVARLVATERVDTNRTYEDVRPTAEQFGDEFRLHVRSGGGDKPVFRGSYPFVQGDSDNGTRMGTFTPWSNNPDATAYQSAPNTR